MILLRGLLAVVIAIVKAGDFVGSVRYLSSSTIYLAMLYIVKPFLKRIGDLYSTKDNIDGKPVMAIFFCYLLFHHMPLKLLVFMPRFYDGGYYARYC
jgi:hypothetical protein